MKKIFAIVIALVLCLSCFISASAATSTYVYNPDGILTTSEVDELSNYARMIERTYGYTFIFCLVEEGEDVSATDYSEDAYYSFTDSKNCYVFTHNIDSGLCGTYAVGKCEEFTEDIDDALFDAYNTNDTYFGGIEAFLAAGEMVAEEYPISNVPQNTPSEDDATDAPEETEPTTEFQRVERTLPLLVDNADLLTADEETALLKRLETFTAEHEMEIAIVTVPDLEGKTVEEYGDDFYDYNGYGFGENDDGILLLYKPGPEGEREAYISTHADGAYKFFDTIREEMLIGMKDYLVAEDYVTAFNLFVDKAEETMKPNVPFIWFFILLLCGATGGMLVTTIMASKNKSVFVKSDANYYMRPNSLVLTNEEDVFINSYTDRTEKVKNDSDDDDGVRSSTHRSSSGRTHGGSSMKF